VVHTHIQRDSSQKANKKYIYISVVAYHQNLQTEFKSKYAIIVSHIGPYVMTVGCSEKSVYGGRTASSSDHKTKLLLISTNLSNIYIYEGRGGGMYTSKF
jgi:hypothetical protein